VDEGRRTTSGAGGLRPVHRRQRRDGEGALSAVVELPEVEVMRRDLEKEVVGKRVRSVEVRPHRNAMRVIRRHARRKEFEDRLAGKKITKVDRKGKYLLLSLEDGDVLVVHFGMSGQFLRGTKRQTLPQHTHVVLEFQQGCD